MAQLAAVVAVQGAGGHGPQLAAALVVRGRRGRLGGRFGRPGHLQRLLRNACGVDRPPAAQH